MLREIARSLDRATAKVEGQWEELPSEERAAYEHFVYAVVEFPSRKRSIMEDLLWRARSAWNLFLIALKDEQEAFIDSPYAKARMARGLTCRVESTTYEQ